MSDGLTEALRDGIGRRLRAILRFLIALPGRFARWLVALPGRTVSFALGLPQRLWNLLVAAKRTVVGPDPEPGELLLGTAATATVAAVVVTFLVANALVVYPLAAFVVTVAVGWVTYQARIAKILTLVATVGTVLTVSFITYFLFESAWPAFEAYGAGLLKVPVGESGEVRWFLWLEGLLPIAEGSTTAWDPANELYSLLPAIWATVIVTIIAGAIAGPLGLLGALFIAEVAGDRLREVIKPAVEILAGIPSIVYGFIGFQVLNGFVQDAFLDAGASFLIAGIVVGIMALPTVVSVAEDAISSVPSSMRDGAIAMGATEWQTMKSISIPAAFSGISAAVILGLGRAIGETMAVAAIMAAGTDLAFPLWDVFDQGVTLTSRIATAYGSASDATVEVLFVAGVMLFVIVAGMSVVAQYVERRMKMKLQGER
jgi:phosphate transport system permease protein